MFFYRKTVLFFGVMCFLLSKGLRPHAAGPLSLEMRLRSGEVARCIGELRLSSGEVAMASGGFPGAPQARRPPRRPRRPK